MSVDERTLFRPRSYQRASLIAKQRGIRRFCEVLHRRAGKDRNWLNTTFLSMLERPGVYQHVFPTVNQGARDLWNNVFKERLANGTERSVTINDVFPSELLAKNGTNETEMSKTLFNGSFWQIAGADDKKAIDRLRGANPIGIIFSEYSHMSEDIWPTLFPVLAENKGWAAFIFTPNGRNHAWELYERVKGDPEWFVQRLTINDTKRDAEGEDGSAVVSIEDVEAARRAGMRESWIQQEFYCSFEGFMKGTIYGDLMEQAQTQGRIGNFPYDARLPVGLCIDLGHADKTAVWFYQHHANTIRFIDYHEDELRSPQWWVQFLREHKPYTYGRMCLPHDGRGHAAFFDAAGFKNIQLALRLTNIQTGIDNVRLHFTQFYFDQTACRLGIQHLEAYSYKANEDTKVFALKPQHDIHSHAADALRSGVDCGFVPLLYEPYFNAPITVETKFDPRTMPQRLR